MKYLRWSCVALVLVWSALHAQQPASKLSESEKSGERLYLQRCALCHSGTAPAYVTYGPPLDGQAVARRGDESVRKLIMEGSARMPGFRYSLDRAQVDRLIAFLKTLKDSSYAAEAEPARARLAARLLTGTVRSAGGDELAGVAVSARAVDKTFTTTVYSDERGRYVFPALDGGDYRVWAQAVGFEAGRAEARVDPGRPASHDFTLRTVKDFTMQLSGSDWMAALPEDTPQHRRLKQLFQTSCTGCHVPQFVLQNRFDEAGWHAVITAMETFTSTGSWRKAPQPWIQHYKPELAAYLAEMRGPGPSPMTFALPARPEGDAARVVITEYDVPPAETPDQLVPHDGADWAEGAPSAYWAKGLHDVVPDLDGNAWINDSVTNKTRTYARVDAKTGKVTNFTVPGGGDGYVRGSHSLAIGADGIIWMDLYPGRAPVDEGSSEGSVGRASIARLDPRTTKLDVFDSPRSLTAVSDFVAVDGKGKVWAVTRAGALRFDPDTKQFADFRSETPGSRPGGGNYDVAGDIDGNGWWAVISHDKLGVGNVKTGTSVEIPLMARKEMEGVATAQDREFYRSLQGASTFGNNIGLPWAQGPRRLGADPTGPTMWVANWWGDNIAEVDIRTHKVTYHPVPIANSGPYDVDVDNQHTVWVTLRNAETVAKFEASTRRWTVYRLPTQGVEARHISVDRVRGEVWIPYWRTSKVGRLQFRSESQLRAATSP